MGRKIIAVILGFIAGITLIYVGDSVCMRLYSPPIGFNPMDQGNFNSYVAATPIYVMAVMLFFWMLSSFFGGLVAGLINRPDWKTTSLITGGVLLAAAILNMINVQHPTWMVISAIALYLPMAYLGGLTVSGKKLPIT